MFKIVKCRGVLLKAMNRNIQQMSLVAFFLAIAPLITLCLIYPPTIHNSTLSLIPVFLLLWYMISLFTMSKMSYEEGDLHKIFTLPVYLSLKASVLIFRFFLKRKYPEMEEEHYQRWIKIKTIQKQINKKH